MLVGVLFYCINSQDFSSVQNNRIIDGLYYCIITFYTVGYGDIVPITPATKVFCCIFVLIGVGPINIMISDAIDYIVDIIIDYIVDIILAGAFSCIIGAEMERMKMYLMVACAISILVFCMLALHIMEDLDWMNSVYLSVISMTTVGYGDMVFKTMTGRIFAFFWLLLMPIVMALAMRRAARLSAGRALHTGSAKSCNAARICRTPGMAQCRILRKYIERRLGIAAHGCSTRRSGRLTGWHAAVEALGEALGILPKPLMHVGTCVC